MYLNIIHLVQCIDYEHSRYQVPQLVWKYKLAKHDKKKFKCKKRNHTELGRNHSNQQLEITYLAWDNVSRNSEALYSRYIKLLSRGYAILKCQKVIGNALIRCPLKRYQARFIWINENSKSLWQFEDCINRCWREWVFLDEQITNLMFGSIDKIVYHA